MCALVRNKLMGKSPEQTQLEKEEGQENMLLNQLADAISRVLYGGMELFEHDLNLVDGRFGANFAIKGPEMMPYIDGKLMAFLPGWDLKSRGITPAEGGMSVVCRYTVRYRSVVFELFKFEDA